MRTTRITVPETMRMMLLLVVIPLRTRGNSVQARAGDDRRTLTTNRGVGRGIRIVELSVNQLAGGSATPQRWEGPLRGSTIR